MHRPIVFLRPLGLRLRIRMKKILGKLDLLITILSVFIYGESLTTEGRIDVPYLLTHEMRMASLFFAGIGILSYLSKVFKTPIFKAIVNAWVVSSFFSIVAWDVLYNIPMIGVLANQYVIWTVFLTVAIYAYIKRVSTYWSTLVILLVIGVTVFKLFFGEDPPFRVFSTGIREIALNLGWILILLGIGFHLITSRKISKKPSTRRTTTQPIIAPQNTVQPPNQGVKDRASSENSNSDYDNIQF